MIRLIVNADDFGQSPGVNAGIIIAHQKGIVTSTTIMANGAAFDEAVQMAHSNPTIGVGVHLNLVEGCPITIVDQVRSLVCTSGRFHSKIAFLRRCWLRQIRLEELKREVEAQIDRVIAAGIRPTHIDSHQHVHACPDLFKAVLAIASSRGIRAIRLPVERIGVRDCFSVPFGLPRTVLLNQAARLVRHFLDQSQLKTTDRFVGTLRTGRTTASWLRGWLPTLRVGTTELMVHPGYCDEPLRQTGTRLTTQREIELSALTDTVINESVRSLNIDLIHYGEIKYN